MKINIVSHSDSSGGAARAAFRLHKALNKNNVDSEMLVAKKNSDDFKVINCCSKTDALKRSALNFVSQKIQKLQQTKNPILHSSNLFGSSVFNKIQQSNADIVNLHWVNGETLSIKQIAKINKPIVMTLHDMWAFCGTEHLSVDSKNSQFRLGYQGNNQDSDYLSGLNLNKIIWERKKKYWAKPFTIVTPSTWLTNCVKESSLFKDWEVHTIPNPLDTDIFKPCDQQIARQLLNLPQDKKLIGFGAMGGGKDPNKGFDLLQSALNQLDHNNDYVCIVFGQSEPINKPDLKLPIKYLGHLYDDVTLALFYNAIDVMVVPSRQENLPQTATEAQACGTPVVAFNTTGLVDVVEHLKTGYLSKIYDYYDFCKGINWCIENEHILNISINARNKAIKSWAEINIANEYNSIYENILRSKCILQ